jgi:hypothetical protein
MMQQYTSEFDRLCNNILEVNNNIQSVAVLNKFGRPVEKSSRPRYAEQFPDKTSEMLFMQCVLEISMARDFEEQYGSINYHMSERANVTMLTLPIEDHVILVTANKNISPILLVKKIVSIINEYKHNSLLKNTEDNGIPITV